MKLTIDAAPLRAALKWAGAVAKTKSTVAILHHVKLVADDGVLEITACNMTLQACAHLACDVAESGEICAPAEQLNAFAASCTTDRVEIAIENGRLVLRAGKSRARLGVLDAAAFPRLGAVASEGAMVIAGAALAAAIDFVDPHVSEDEAITTLFGALLWGHDGSLELCGAERARMARVRVTACDRDLRIVLPPSVLPLAKALAGNASDSITLSTTASLARLVAGEREIVTRLIDVDYPQVDRATPGRVADPVRVNIAELARTVAAAVAVAGDGKAAGPRSVTLARDGEGIDVSAGGEHEFHATVEATGGAEGARVVLQGRYLLDACASLGNDGIAELHLGKPNEAVRLGREGNDTDVIVLMPIRG